MSQPAKISLSKVRKSYAGRPILDGISLAIAERSFVALVGPSGAGKTTLLKTINRLVEPDEGAVGIDGRDIRSQPITDLRRRIGYVFQQIGLFPHMTVAENVALVPSLLGAPPAERAARVAELLQLVALPAEFAGRLPAALSGGQAQRVGFARALAAHPAVVLMDEPFGALDPVTRADLGQAYRALHDRLGLTSLIVTHDMAEALLLADRVIVLADGRVRADQSPARLMTDSDDPLVRSLIAVPRGQAERLLALERGE